VSASAPLVAWRLRFISDAKQVGLGGTDRPPPDVQLVVRAAPLRRAAGAAAVVTAVALAGCGGDGPTARTGSQPTPTGPSASEDPEAATAAPESPPPVTVRSGGRSLELQPWSYCYGNVCADGFPPADPPDVGSPKQIVVDYPLTGWSFTASFRPADDKCGRQQDVPLEPQDNRTHVLSPAGHAGTYDVTLFGQGNGDLFVTFRWTTPSDGPLPTPEARLAVIADNDGRVDSYGVELEVKSLAATPIDAAATITVRAEDGRAVTFDATRAAIQCLPAGTVYWDGPDDQGLAAAALGEGPFTYEVALVLDGVRHMATAAWPDDVIVGNEPSVTLQFQPDLPALT
jgi:hypothetical protein